MEISREMTLKAPFPWFGGKSRVATEVWDRFGAVDNYVEPFAGSLAVLLSRPNTIGTETVNDIDCFLANFWRATSIDPEAVAGHADGPVNEADLHARHLWLVNQNEFRERMKTDPDFYEAKIAGWWVWGISQWIGSGWCSRPEWTGRARAGAKDRGIHAGISGEDSVWAARPALGTDGQGVDSGRLSRNIPSLGGSKGVHRKLPSLGDKGKGTHSKVLAQQIPALSSDGMGIDAEALNKKERHAPPLADDGTARVWGKRPDLHCKGKGVHGTEQNEALFGYFEALRDRLRRVRVCCGDWTRVLGPSVTVKHGVCGVFLDPPYDMRGVGGDKPADGLYAVHDNDISAAVRAWAIENGGNPLLRIALCGYEGEHEMPNDWECVRWKAVGGYGSLRKDKSNQNAGRERVWFSPHCLKLPSLFVGLSEQRGFAEV